jgi:methylated-DNA-[protein]-cysteine S-methyltransferase
MPKKKEINQNKTFSERVVSVVKEIPVGKTKSYQEVAELAGNLKASRAVANLMAKNYDPDIPCHRVIRKDGSMGGYNRGGEEVKRKILQEESMFTQH